MEYTIQKLAGLAGISTRTLRYYDEIGLLKPLRTSSSGYRIYGEKEIVRLQQILFYRELGLSLDKIGEIVTSGSFDEGKALQEHKRSLEERKKQIEELLVNVERSIEDYQGRIKMKDKQRFEGFKKDLVEENDRKYGAEARQKYGDDAYEKSNAKVMGMTEADYERAQKLASGIITALHEAMEGGDPASETAQKAADLHKEWLTMYWDKYSPEAHAGLAQMYVDDERFKAYYDREKPGTAEFLRDAVQIFTGMNK
ncbi:MerR family transcriptional regulator [Youngiibacter fragilis]|uniref:MerR family transcriptional regulator n=1 Tax=Youngiibacter fragilis 232.1 TaxID=994573 RepID=V7I3J4_9CLOT|nr:MerR family transcriptional regulator [Youngiibacter fragilis]ETA79562.1 MerR family transcriptional regulator [Youngiibacter fragilis 232.1]